MISPEVLAKVSFDKEDLTTLEKCVDQSIIKFHGWCPWEEAILDGEYSDEIMEALLKKYKEGGWSYIYWRRSSENDEPYGLTSIMFSTTPLEDKFIRNRKRF